jgi:hypothetical protein
MMRLYTPALLLVGILWFWSAAQPLQAQVQPDHRAIARDLVSSDRDVQWRALIHAERIPPDEFTSELRNSVILALRSESALRQVRWEAYHRGEDLEPITDDLYGRLIERVVAFGDPAAIPVLAGAVGTGNMAIRALVGFGEQAVPAIVKHVNNPAIIPYHVGSGLIALRMIVERATDRPLTPVSQEGIRSTAHRFLTDGDDSVTLSIAIDLAVALDDDELMGIVRVLASDSDSIRARGIADPERVAELQRHAQERLAGKPALPRFPNPLPR